MQFKFIRPPTERTDSVDNVPRPGLYTLLRKLLRNFKNNISEWIGINTNYDRRPVDAEKYGKRIVFLDGSNVAYAHSNHQFFSCEGLRIALNFFEKLGHVVRAVVPDKRLKSGECSNPNMLRELYAQGKIIFTPCKDIAGRNVCSYDDRILLQYAYDDDGVVISNDKFRDLINESAEYRQVIETSVIGYSWHKDDFLLPKDPYGRYGRRTSEILNRK